MNPVRAGLVTCLEAWPWSSAAAHLAGTRLPGAAYPPDDALPTWRAVLGHEDPPGTLETIRHGTTTGRPVGDAVFLDRLEAATGKSLQRNPRGRPKKITA